MMVHIRTGSLPSRSCSDRIVVTVERSGVPEPAALPARTGPHRRRIRNSGAAAGPMGRVRIRPLRRPDPIATSTRRARPSPGVATDQGTLGRHGPETPLEAPWGALTARVRSLTIRAVFEPIKFATTMARRLSRPSAASRTLRGLAFRRSGLGDLL